MNINVTKNNEVIGPFEKEILLEKLNRGEFQPNDLACLEGDETWHSLQDFFPSMNQSEQLIDGSSNTNNQNIESVSEVISPSPKMNFALYLLPLIPLTIIYSFVYLRIVLSRALFNESHLPFLYGALAAYILWLIVHSIFTFRSWAAISSGKRILKPLLITLPYFLPFPLMLIVSILNFDFRYITEPIPLLMCFVFLNGIWSIIIFFVYPKQYYSYSLKHNITQANPLSSIPYRLYAASMCLMAFVQLAFPIASLLVGVLYLVLYFVVIVKTVKAVNSLADSV